MKEFQRYVLPIFGYLTLIFLSQIYDLEFLQPLGLGALTIYYLYLDNPYKDFLKWVASSIGISVVVVVATFYFTSNTIIIAIGSLFVLTTYSFRFYKRPDKLFIDYLKVLGIMAFTVFLFISIKLNFIALVFLGLIYLLDRIIIRRQMSKTLQIVTFCVMGFVMFTMIIYANIKASEAMKNLMLAEAQQMESMRMTEVDQQAQTEAMNQAEQAARQMQLMSQEIEDIKSKLKDCQSN